MCGISAGSFWPSASIVMRNSPRAAENPASKAAVCPLLGTRVRTLNPGVVSRLRSRNAGVPWVEPSSMTMTSKGRLSSLRTAKTSSSKGGRASSSLNAGITAEISIVSARFTFAYLSGLTKCRPLPGCYRSHLNSATRPRTSLNIFVN